METGRRVRQTFIETHQEISPHLTPEQRTKLAAMEERHRRREGRSSRFHGGRRLPRPQNRPPPDSVAAVYDRRIFSDKVRRCQRSACSSPSSCRSRSKNHSLGSIRKYAAPLASGRANASDSQFLRRRRSGTEEKLREKLSRDSMERILSSPDRPRNISGERPAENHLDRRRHRPSASLSIAQARAGRGRLQSGLEGDLKPWHPHVTLARCRDVSPESVRPFLKANAEFDAGMVHVESFVLYSSKLTPAGPIIRQN